MNMQRSRSTATMVLATAIVVAILAWTAMAQGDATASQEQLERGEKIYQETAGGVGCAYCHGVLGMGDGTAGAGAPVIAGAQLSAIRSSLAGAVPMMGFIKLLPSELEDVAAYVAYLGTLSGSDADDSESGETASESEEGVRDSASMTSTTPRFDTVNVAATTAGFEPAVITVPVGEQVQLIFRNRTLVEHHFRVPDMPIRDPVWLATPEGEREEGVSDEDHTAHHVASTFVSWRARSLAGIQPTGDIVHLWAHTAAADGGKDVMRFTATQPGTYQVSCPLHPEMTAEIRVE